MVKKYSKLFIKVLEFCIIEHERNDTLAWETWNKGIHRDPFSHFDKKKKKPHSYGFHVIVNSVLFFNFKPIEKLKE